MPYAIRPAGNGKHEVVNTETGHVMGHGMSEENAKSQLRLLNAIEHGYKPSKGGKLSKKQGK